MNWFERRQARRREQERRNADPAAAAEVHADKRKAERRQDDRRDVDRRQLSRRKYFRVVYPPDEGPKVLNVDYRVLDLAQNTIRFACKNGAAPALQANGPVEATLQFRDGETLSVQGKIARLHQDLAGEQTFFVCMLDELIPQKKVNEEQRYLLKNFPNFCREEFDRRRIIIED
jgi:hypothetical protein